MGLKRVFCFQEWGLSLPQLGEEWSEVCLESRDSSSGTSPPSQCGKPTLGGDSPCLLCVHGLRGVQIREVGRRPRNNLASADTKPGPSDPAGLHGGCT